MKRPLVLVGFSYLLTLAAAVCFGAEAAFWLFWCCLALFSASVIWKRTRTAMVFPVAFLTAAVAFGSFAGYFQAAVRPPQALDGKDAVIEGTVIALPYRQYDRWYYLLDLDSVSVSGAPQRFEVRLSSQEALSAEPYSRIRANVHFFLPQGDDSSGSRAYYESRKIRMFAYLPAYGTVAVQPAQSKPPYYYALILRRAMLSSVDSMLPPEEASLVKGVLLGDKTSLSDGTVSDFRVDGVSHLLAVSGLHMATIAQLLILLLQFLRIPKKLASPLAGAGIFSFMAVTGFVPSVTRSGIMCLLWLMAPLISRRADALNSLGIATLVLCLPNPYAAADVGLLLSFFATLGLILLAEPVQNWLNARLDRFRRIRPLVRGVNGILATSAAAILFTLPVMILSFGSVSLIAPLSNLLMLVPSSLMIGFSAVAAVVGLVAPHSFLLMPPALASGLLARYLLACAHLLARIPFASISASCGFVFLWLGGSLILFAAAYAMRIGKRLAVTAGFLSAVILTVGILSYRIDEQGVTRVAVLDVGTGLSVVATYSGHAAQFGCGGYNSGETMRYLASCNLQSLDSLKLLTADRDELANSAEIAGRFPPAVLTALPSEQVDGYVQKAAAVSGAVFWSGGTNLEPLCQTVLAQSVLCGKASAVRLETGGASILILPAEADASLLPQNWRTPDFLVTDGWNVGRGLIRPVCTVLSMDGDDLRENHIGPEARTAWTGGFGRIVLELKGDRKVSVRRET